MEETEKSPGSVVVGGYTHLPANVSAHCGLLMVSLDLDLDLRRRKVVGVRCSIPGPLVQKLLDEILIGHDLEAGIETPRVKIQERYQSAVQEALIGCLEDAYARYLSMPEVGEESGRERP